MYRQGVLLSATLHAIRSQPTGCSDDAHCPTGSYCDSVQMFCHLCLQCNHFMREQPTNIDCVSSVTDCGPCLKGSTEDKSSYTLKCTPANMLPAGPSHSWIIIIATLLAVALLLCVAAAFLLRNFRAYKLFTAIRTVEQRSDEDLVVETELLPPPPYNTVALATQHDNKQDTDDTPPAVLRVEAISPPAATQLGCESARHQTARVFNAPVYDRDDSTLPSYEIAALREDLDLARRTLNSNNTNGAVISDHNQNLDPTPRTTPSDSLNTTMNGESSEKPTSRTRQELHHSESSEGCGEDSPNFCGSFYPQNLCIINVIRNNASVQQNNELAI